MELSDGNMARPTTALIVDDEAHVRTYLRMLLREVGIETSWEAADGGSVLSLVAEHKPELVLLDLSLPVKGGLEVLGELSEAHPDLPVVIVSTQTATGTVQRTALLGAVGYVLKHSPKDQAIASLREILDSLEGTDEEEGAGA